MDAAPVFRAFLGLVLFALPAAKGAELHVVVDRSETVVLTDPRPSTTEVDGLSIELAEVLEAVVVRGRDGLLRAVMLADCNAVERIQRQPARFALTLKDSRVVEGELLTFLTGRARGLLARIAPDQIEEASWSRRPATEKGFRSYFAQVGGAAATVHLRSAPGRVAFGLELDKAWFAYLEDDKVRPLYRSELTLGRVGKTASAGLVRGSWELDVDLEAVRRVAFNDAGPLRADVEVAGARPFLDAVVFGRWAESRDLRDALYLMGLDRGVLYAIPIRDVAALSRRGEIVAEPVQTVGEPWEVTVEDGTGSRTFRLTEVVPVYGAAEPLFQKLVNSLKLVVLAGEDGHLAATPLRHVRRGHRNGEAAVLVLADQRPVEGRWVGALEGRTAYGPVLLSGAAILSLVSSDQGAASPVQLGWSSSLLARVRKLDGTRRDLQNATWLLVPDASESDGGVGTSGQLALLGSGWVDRIDLESTLAVARNPHAASPPWRVSIADAPALFGEISAVPQDCLAKTKPRQDRWSTWIGGVDGAAAFFVPMTAVESLTLEGQRAPRPPQARGTLHLRAAVPSERQVRQVRPVVDDGRMPALLEMAAAVHAAMVLEEEPGVFALVPLSAVERIEAADGDSLRAFVVLPRRRDPVEIVGRPVSGLEGETVYGSTCVSAPALAGYLPLASEEMTVNPWQKVTSLTDLRLTLRDGPVVDLDFTFFADEVRESNVRLPAYVHELVLDVNGLEETWSLADLQEARFEGDPGARSPVRARLRRAEKPPREGEVKLLSRIDGAPEYGTVDEGDMVCGLRGGIVRCVRLRQVESMVRK